MAGVGRDPVEEVILGSQVQVIRNLPVRFVVYRNGRKPTYAGQLLIMFESLKYARQTIY